MAQLQRQLALLLMLLVTLTSSSRNHKHHSAKEKKDGILMRSVSRLGEAEVRVRYGRITALESVIPAEGEEGLFYRQVTDGRFFLQAVYKGRDNMVDCELIKDGITDELSRFVTSFNEKEWEMRKHHLSNATIVPLDESSSKGDDLVRHLLDMPTMKTACRRLHRQQKREVKEKNKLKRKRGNAVHAFNHLLGENVPVPKSDSMKAKAHHGSIRNKRFIYPGTNWCGSGNDAREYGDLGDNVATDKCCRGHDHCPYTIGGFSKKYHYFNFRFHTLSHCHCDEIFRSCLRSAVNNVADMVGQIYFNVVGSKCFTLKKIQTCRNRSWWGSCIEYKDDHQAEVNEPFGY